MKNLVNLKILVVAKALIFCYLVLGVLEGDALGQQDVKTNEEVTLGDIISSCKTDNIDQIQQVYRKQVANKLKLGTELTAILQNPNTSNLGKCVAAYYIGEIGYDESVTTLAENISFQLDMSQIPIKHLVKLDFLQNSYLDALVKIGGPSIPALIKNLEKTEDPKVIQLSVMAITRIDKDRELTQWRLNRAISLQTDVEKKTKLKSALVNILNNQAK